MKRMSWLMALAALLAAGAQAQSNGSPAPAGRHARHMAWAGQVSKACSAETSRGGVCAGKDFKTGLMDCLHKNRKALSSACLAAARMPHSRLPAAPARP